MHWTIANMANPFLLLLRQFLDKKNFNPYAWAKSTPTSKRRGFIYPAWSASVAVIQSIVM